jgi:tripartite motif-containing protein 71
LRRPEAIAIGPRGDVYVGDQFSYVVQRFSARGRFEGEWGSYGSGDGQFGAVGGLAVDSLGHVYAIDSTHDRVEKFDARGRFIASWGRHGSGLGEFDFGGGGGPARPPNGAIAVRGRYAYVADTRNNRIERFRLDGSAPTTWGGKGAGRGEFSYPRGIAVTANAIYVADDDNRRIQMFDRHGRFLRQAGSFGSGPGQFADPYGVAADRTGDVFVADDNNNRIVRLTRKLAYAGTWNLFGRTLRLGYVRGLAADSSGHVYVADTGNDRVEEFDRHGAPLRRWGRSGAGPGEFVTPMGVASGRLGDLFLVGTLGSRSYIDRFTPSFGFRSHWLHGGSTAIGHHFFSPTAIDVAPDGSIWVTDLENDLVRHLSREGSLIDTVGGRASDPASRLSSPRGVAVDGSGDVYVADTGDDRVLKFSGGARRPATWTVASGARVRDPIALAVDRAGDTYVADEALQRVIEMTPLGRPVRSWRGRAGRDGAFGAIAGLAVDSAGDVYVSDRQKDRVQEFANDGRFLAEWGKRGIRAGDFIEPAGLTVDCSGDLIVADSRNNRIEIFTGVAQRASCARRAR